MLPPFVSRPPVFQRKVSERLVGSRSEIQARSVPFDCTVIAAGRFSRSRPFVGLKCARPSSSVCTDSITVPFSARRLAATLAAGFPSMKPAAKTSIEVSAEVFAMTARFVRRRRLLAVATTSSFPSFILTPVSSTWKSPGPAPITASARSSVEKRAFPGVDSPSSISPVTALV